MLRVPKEMKEFQASPEPWDCRGWKDCQAPRAIAAYLVHLVLKVPWGSPVVVESQGSLESRVSEGRSERQDSRGPRDLREWLAALEKTGLLDSWEPQVDQETEDPKGNEVTLAFLVNEAFKARGDARVTWARSDQSDRKA